MTQQPETAKARAVGINHVALEVGDIDAALEFYGAIFEISLRGRSETMAFIDLGDQFIALSVKRTQPPDTGRHFGLVVDDAGAIRRALEEMSVEEVCERMGMNANQVYKAKAQALRHVREVLDRMGT